MLDKLGGPKKAGIIGGGVLAMVALCVVLFVVFTGGEEESPLGPDGEIPILTFDDEPEPAPAPVPVDPALAPPPVEEVPVDPVLDPGVDPIQQAVQATIEAMDQRQLADLPPEEQRQELIDRELADDRNRSGVAPRIDLRLLDQNKGSRNPYLNAYEVDYFEDLGGHFWAYTRVWLILRNLTALDVEVWTARRLGTEIQEMNEITAPFVDRRPVPAPEVGDIVLDYGEELEKGFEELDMAIEAFETALTTLVALDETEQMSNRDRNDLIAVRRAVLQHAENFHNVMASYGCAVCGELFRQ